MSETIENLKDKLKEYKKEDIIITDHAKIQAIVRDIEIDEVKQNILNPKRLIYAKKQKAENPDEEKYDCYFAYSENLCHRYVLTVNGKVIIVTIIKINRGWQKIIERK